MEIKYEEVKINGEKAAVNLEEGDILLCERSIAYFTKGKTYIVFRLDGKIALIRDDRLYDRMVKPGVFTVISCK